MNKKRKNEAILIPKEKQSLDQKISTKKKKFFRLLQSNPNSLSFCLTANNKFKSELESMFKKIVDEERLKRLPKIIEVTEKNDKKKRKSKSQQVIKFPEIVFGLNETFKLIERKQIAMIWLEQSLAMNLKNVIQKLCNDNQIFCLNFELKFLQSILNLSSMAVISFKVAIRQKDSMFNELYLLINKTFDLNENQSSQSTSEIKIEALKLKLSEVSKNEPDDVIIEEPVSFYLEPQLDPYQKIMKNRIEKKSNEPERKDEFTQNLLFVSLLSLSDDEYFIDYQQRCDKWPLKVEIIWRDKTMMDRKESSNRFAEQLFELDKFESNAAYGSKQIKFQIPKLIKGHCDEQKSVLKRKKKADKKAIKMKKGQFICKKMKTSEMK